MSLKEITYRMPSLQMDVVVIERSEEEIDKKGGNQYELGSEDETVDTKFLRDKVYAYSDGEDMYVNSKSFIGQTGYSRVMSDGRYLAFRGRSGSDEASASVGMMFGLIGAMITQAATHNRGGTKWYIFDKDDLLYGIKDLNPGVLRKLVKSASEKLFAQYKEEEKPLTSEVELYYLDTVNQLWTLGGYEPLPLTTEE